MSRGVGCSVASSSAAVMKIKGSYEPDALSLGFVERLNNKIRVFQRRAGLPSAQRRISASKSPHLHVAGIVVTVH